MIYQNSSVFKTENSDNYHYTGSLDFTLQEPSGVNTIESISKFTCIHWSFPSQDMIIIHTAIHHEQIEPRIITQSLHMSESQK